MDLLFTSQNTFFKQCVNGSLGTVNRKPVSNRNCMQALDMIAMLMGDADRPNRFRRNSGQTHCFLIIPDPDSRIKEDAAGKRAQIAGIARRWSCIKLAKNMDVSSLMINPDTENGPLHPGNNPAATARLGSHSKALQCLSHNAFGNGNLSDISA